MIEKMNNNNLRGNIGITWLGQAGFLIKTPNNEKIIIDPYLSNCCQEGNSFKRVYPSIIYADKLLVDLIIISHEHHDHFDIDSIPLMLSNDNTMLAGPRSVIKECIDLGIDKKKLILLEKEKEVLFGKIKMLAVYADHGRLSPDALGIILYLNNLKLYFTGDTSYRPDKMKKVIDLKPEIIIPPINGKYGNLDSIDAAKLTRDVQAKACIPCHFWTFIEHNGNPQQFLEEVEKYAPECKCNVLTVGKEYIYN